MNMGSTTSIYGIKWSNRSIFRIRFFKFFVKYIFNKNRKKSMFSPKIGSLLNKSLEKFGMPGFQNFWSYGMSIRAQTLKKFAEFEFLGFKVFRAHGIYSWFLPPERWGVFLLNSAQDIGAHPHECLSSRVVFRKIAPGPILGPPMEKIFLVQDVRYLYCFRCVRHV